MTGSGEMSERELDRANMLLGKAYDALVVKDAEVARLEAANAALLTALMGATQVLEVVKQTYGLGRGETAKLNRARAALIDSDPRLADARAIPESSGETK